MAREVVMRCDVCGEAGEDVRTVMIRDGRTWEVDLCDKHMAPLHKIAEKGREIAATGRVRNQAASLDSMVRNAPE